MFKKIFGSLLLGVFCSAAAAQNAWLIEFEEKTREILNDPAQLAATMQAGKRHSFFCVHCHGETGMAASDGVPNLTEQSVSYLFEQNLKYVTGERKDAFMEGLLKVLTDEEILQISIFYHL